MWNTEFLCTHCWGIGPHLMARGKPHGISRVEAEIWGIFSSYNGDGPSKLVFIQGRQDSCLVERDTSILSSRLDRPIVTPLEVRWETQGPFLVATVILGFLSIFKRSQESSPFEALNCAFLSNYQQGVKLPVEMRWGTRAFISVFTGKSDIPSSCEMKDKPPFKSLKGNPALFRHRASLCPFHLRQQTQCPSHTYS